MSECVVSMEMPQDCFECPMCDWNRQKLCCNAHHELRPIPNGGVPKPDWCYVICQLPEGHGRLIDASYVIDVMQDELDNDVPITVDDCFQIECKIPTIVPAERSET